MEEELMSMRKLREEEKVMMLKNRRDDPEK